MAAYPTPIQIDQRIVPMILDMQRGGIGVNPDHFIALEKEFGLKMAAIQHEVEQYAGGYINMSSHPQISTLLYKHLKIAKPKIKSKKSGATMTGEEILAQIAGEHPAVQLIRDYRMYDKLVNTYVRPIYTKHIHPDGRVYPKFKMTATETNRLAAEDPNIMAIPKKTAEGKRIRKGFVPRRGRVVTSQDFAQIEMRVLAWQAGETKMIDLFRRGVDLHSATAMWMFDIADESKLDKDQHRQPAKRIGFGVVYGISAIGLYRQMVVTKGCEHWTEAMCQDAIDRWFGIYPAVKAYMSDIGSFAKRHGYVCDFTGGRRIIPGAQLKDERLQAEALRQAGNAPIQSGAGKIMKMAMYEVDRQVYRPYREMGYYISPWCPIHDDLVTEMDEDIADVVVPLQKQVMESVVDLPTGLEVDPQISSVSWGDLEGWKGAE